MNKFFLKTLIPAAALFVLLPGCVRAVRAEGGGLSLPTAGLSYALSQPDTRASVKDVEDYLTASGMIRTRKGDAVKGTDEKKQDKSAQQTKSGSAAVVPEVTEIVDTALTKKQQREADATVSQTAILIEETAAAAGREIDDSYSKEVVAVAKAVEAAPEGATTEEAVSIAKEEVVLAQRALNARRRKKSWVPSGPRQRLPSRKKSCASRWSVISSISVQNPARTARSSASSTRTASPRFCPSPMISAG